MPVFSSAPPPFLFLVDFPIIHSLHLTVKKKQGTGLRGTDSGIRAGFLVEVGIFLEFWKMVIIFIWREAGRGMRYCFKDRIKFSLLSTLVWSCFFYPSVCTYIIGSFPPLDLGSCASLCTDCPLPASWLIHLLHHYKTLWNTHYVT